MYCIALVACSFLCAHPICQDIRVAITGAVSLLHIMIVDRAAGIIDTLGNISCNTMLKFHVCHEYVSKFDKDNKNIMCVSCHLQPYGWWLGIGLYLRHLCTMLWFFSSATKFLFWHCLVSTPPGAKFALFLPLELISGSLLKLLGQSWVFEFWNVWHTSMSILDPLVHDHLLESGLLKQSLSDLCCMSSR